jgi:hypothetical protein
MLYYEMHDKAKGSLTDHVKRRSALLESQLATTREKIRSIEKSDEHKKEYEELTVNS